MLDHAGNAGPNTEHRWLRTPQVAAITRLKVPSLNKMRVVGGGPPFIKLGRALLYEQAALYEWMDHHKQRHSTSE